MFFFRHRLCTALRHLGCQAIPRTARRPCKRCSAAASIFLPRPSRNPPNTSPRVSISSSSNRSIASKASWYSDSHGKAMGFPHARHVMVQSFSHLPPSAARSSSGSPRVAREHWRCSLSTLPLSCPTRVTVASGPRKQTGQKLALRQTLAGMFDVKITRLGAGGFILFFFHVSGRANPSHAEPPRSVFKMTEPPRAAACTPRASQSNSRISVWP